MADRILDSGCVGSRIKWVRLTGPVFNMFVIVMYVSHRGRTKASYVKDIIKLIQNLLSTMNKTDCVILMGDLNCEIQRNVNGCTGQCCMTKRKDNVHGEEILTLMRSYDLFTVNTFYKPKRKAWRKDKMCYSHGHVRTHRIGLTSLQSCRVQLLPCHDLLSRRDDLHHY